MIRDESVNKKKYLLSQLDTSNSVLCRNEAMELLPPYIEDVADSAKNELQKRTSDNKSKCCLENDSNNLKLLMQEVKERNYQYETGCH
uniref:Bm13494 n=1 Tax=Brugia malayi TaxID=6279 RepID=A0A1I9G328_BRUMA|nr:Bm13494 [Brugia malayi]